MVQSATDKKEAFSELYLESFDYVYSFVRARTAGDSQLTEEIVQETFMSAWLSFDWFRKTSSFRTWVCSIAKNKLRESYRKAIRREKHEFIYGDGMVERESDLNVEKDVLIHEAQSAVLSTLRELNPSYRYALILKYIDDLSVREIAEVMGRSPKAVDGVLQRAKCAFEKAYMQTEGCEKDDE